VAFGSGIAGTMKFSHIPLIDRPTATHPIVHSFLNRKILTFFIFVALSLTTFYSSPTFAVEPSEVLADTALEARARDISKGFRCVVCQNQSIDDSNAGLARDMRLLVRERLVVGDTNAEVTDYIVSRYGSYVLLKPPLNKSTYALWYGPLLILALGFLILLVFFHRRQSSSVLTTEGLNDEEQRRIKALLEDEE
jgi:cytochrome c-type biogenesis protein CcmH